MKIFIELLIFVVLGVSILDASVGKITAISGNASLERGQNSFPAVLGSLLETKDSIVTTKDAKAQLTFNDNTIITVGKQSRFSVEEYLFDATSSSTTKFNMVSGTIRAMSGKIGKIAPEKFAVKTKTATIGIRGTDFVVNVSPDGKTSALCLLGSITIQVNGSTVITVVPAGSFIMISAAGVISDVTEFKASELSIILHEGFTVTPVSIATTVATAQSSVQLDANTPLALAADSSLPVLNPDESLDRGAAVPIDSLIIDAGNVIITDNVIVDVIATIPPSSILPPDAVAFSGFTSVIYQQPIYVETAPSSGIFDFFGNQVFTGRGTVALTSIPSTSSVLGSMLINDTAGSPLWTINLGATTNYTALDSFSASIASYTWAPSFTTYTADPFTIANDTSFTTVVTDTTGDFFSWGEWVIDPMIYSTTTGIGTEQYTAHGYWAAGSETLASVLDAYRATPAATMTYTGGVIGEVQTVDASGYSVSTSPIATGTISVNVNFGLDTFQSNLAFQTVDTNNYTLTYNGSTATNHLVGSLSGGGLSAGATGSLQGGFYGPTGNIVGGMFDAVSTTDLLKIQGAFKAVAP